MEINVGSYYYYVGVNIEELVNKPVLVLDQVGVCGTKQDVPVYCCVDEEDGCTYKIATTNLSDNQELDRQVILWGLQDCFCENFVTIDEFHDCKFVKE